MMSEELKRLHEKARQLNIPQDPLPLPLFWINQAAGQVSIPQGEYEARMPDGVEGTWFVEQSVCPDRSLLVPLVRPLLPEPPKGMEKAFSFMAKAPHEGIFNTSGGKVRGWVMPAVSVCVLATRLRWIYEEDGRRRLFSNYPADLAASGKGRVTGQVLVLGYAQGQIFELRARGLAGQSMMAAIREASRITRTRTLGLDPSFFYITLMPGERMRLEQGSFYTRIRAYVPPIHAAFASDEEAQDILRLQKEGFVKRWIERVTPAPAGPEETREEDGSRPPESDRVEDWIAWVRQSRERIARAAAALCGGDQDLGLFYAHLLEDPEATEEQIKEGLLPGPMAETPDVLVEVLRQAFS
ncbi:MAG: hypothetical protein RML46_11250 [Anaerolineae bacterium]|nr:hypothetical protein [Anaerolineae bacterium]